MFGTEPDSAAHRVLLCAELCNLICEDCDRQTLLALSRTCHDIKEAALDLLWSEIPDLSVLVRCMPGDLWEERELCGCRYVVIIVVISIVCYGAHGLLVALQGNTGDRLAPIQHVFRQGQKVGSSPFLLGWHAPHVEAALASEDNHLNAGTYRTLSHAAYGMELLPRIQEIIWEIEGDDVYPYITLLLSRMTCRLWLYFPHDLDLSIEERSQSQRMRFSLMPSILSSSPHITELSLRGFKTDLESWPDVRDALNSLRFWSSLQFLTLHYFPEASVIILREIPNLRKLYLFDCHREPLLPLPLPSGCHGFQTLASLKIKNNDLESLIAATSIMRNTPLRSLRAKSSPKDTASVDDWKRLFDVMRDNITHLSLEVVTLKFINNDIDHFNDDEHPRSPMTLDEISGLLVFTNLFHLSLEATHGFDLDDEQIRTLASALPHLKELHLHSYYPLADWPRMTFEGLDSIAQHCPELQSLTVAFDARHIIKRSKNLSICNVNIKSLQILDSAIDDPAAVSVYLSAIFPNLVEFSWVDFHFIPQEVEHALEEMKEKWQEMNDLMKAKKESK